MKRISRAMYKKLKSLGKVETPKKQTMKKTTVLLRREIAIGLLIILIVALGILITIFIFLTSSD